MRVDALETLIDCQAVDAGERDVHDQRVIVGGVEMSEVGLVEEDS